MSPYRDGRKASVQVLCKIAAQRCEGHTTAAAWRSRVKNDHMSRENSRRALRYTAPRWDGRNASVQVLLKITAQRCEGHTTAAAWRSRVKNDHMGRENNRRALRYTAPRWDGRKASVQVLLKISFVAKSTNQAAPPPAERCRGHKSNAWAPPAPKH